MLTRRLAGVRRPAGIAIVCVLLGALACAASAPAATSWWKLTSRSEPAVLQPGQEGVIVVEAANLGDAPFSSTNFEKLLTIEDKLPPGLTATAISERTGTGGSELHLCTLETLTCESYFQELVPYQGIEVFITVRVDSSAQSGTSNRVIISGGETNGAEAPPVANSRPLAVGGTSPSFGVASYEMAPYTENGSFDTQAGSHPFGLTTTIDLDSDLGSAYTGEAVEGLVPIQRTKDLQFELPPGLLGNPTVIPQCSTVDFEAVSIGGESVGGANACAPNTAIGVAETTIGTASGPTTISEPLFNLTPSVGEPARFGFKATFVSVYLDTAVRTGGDYGVTVKVNNISELAKFYGSRVTFWGVPGDPRHDPSRGWTCLDRGGRLPFGLGVLEGECQPPGAHQVTPFITLPTSCTGPWASTVFADSWEAPGSFVQDESMLRNAGGDPVGLDGCNRLNFSPSISVAPDGQAASTPSGLSIGLHVPQEEALNPTGLAESQVRDTTVTLPEGVQLSPAAADGLLSCSLEEIDLEGAGASACPEASKVGTVEIISPLLPEPLVGAAYLAAQNQNPFGSLVALYIVVEDPTAGVLVKLAGKVVPDPVTGRLVSTFENTPQLPFSDLRLHFFGSARAPLTTPPGCGTYTTLASLTPWSGNASATASSAFEINSGPNGAPCASPRPFAPQFNAGSTNIQAGEFTPFTMTMTRPDADQTLSGITLHMPPGLSGSLSKVELCPEPQASQGTCGPGSLIGHTIVSAGLGGDPFTVQGGQVFITGPYKGAPFGLSILNPAKAGPFDLGYVVVRAKIEVNPTTAALTIVSDPLPTIIQGIPLQLQHVQVAIERPEFTFNPTSCEPMSISATLTSTESASATGSSPFQVTNCADLKFTPKFAVSASGHTSRANGASLDVKLSYPLGPKLANIAKVKVELPRQLPSRLSTLQKACTEQVFAANPESCPATSRVGEAVATTPILSGPLTGPAYFVSHGGAKFPELVVVLRGEDGVTVDLHGETFISRAGVTSSTFATVPDVPVGSFELKLPEGPYSALGTTANLCESKLTMPTEFVAQNGAVLHQSTKISVTGCKKTRKATRRHMVKRRHMVEGSKGKRRSAVVHRG